jgi:hypothetical protein
MVTQAFFYNAVLFTYGLVRLRYYNVAAEKFGLFLLPLALGNFLGPPLMGRLFLLGRKLRVSDGQRNIPTGDPGSGHRYFLRVWNSGRRSRRPNPLRLPCWDGLAGLSFLGLSCGRAPNGFRHLLEKQF